MRHKAYYRTNFLERRHREVRRNREIRSSTSENFYSTHSGE
jgi:hypothetical protein